MKKLGIWACILLIVAAGILPRPALAAETEEIAVPIRVQTAGPDEEEIYTVELTPVTSGAPMPEGTNQGRFLLSLKDGETGYIRILCEHLGVYEYTIRQLPGTDPDCTYDRTEYRLRLYVTLAEDGSREIIALLLGQDQQKQPLALFCNRRAEPAYLSVSAWKTMDGNTPEDGAFAFRLLAENGETVYEVKNDGRRVRFPALRFDREGTYRFFLKEAAGTNKKILYDRSVYTMTVTVTKDTDYQASVVWERNGKPWYGTPSFANYTDTGSPKTGDDIGLWFALMGVSAAALALLLVRRKKQ